MELSGPIRPFYLAFLGDFDGSYDSFINLLLRLRRLACGNFRHYPGFLQTPTCASGWLPMKPVRPHITAIGSEERFGKPLRRSVYASLCVVTLTFAGYRG